MPLNYFSFFVWRGRDHAYGLEGWWVSKTEPPPAGVVTRPHGPFEDLDAAKRYFRKIPMTEKAVIVFTHRCPDFRKDFGP